MQVVQIDEEAMGEEYGREMCRSLEQGNILVLHNSPFAPPPEDAELLRSQKQSASSAFKNIAYKPHINKTTGISDEKGMDAEAVHRILSAYSEGALKFLEALLPAYSTLWKVDYATFRPVEEQGRDLPINRRNDLMHVDAFPTRPTHGGRILRLFTNIHPDKPRVWVTSWPFEELIKRYAQDAGLDEVLKMPASLRRSAAGFAHKLGLKVPDNTAYDDFMLRFHQYLKANQSFQNEGKVDQTAFPPNCSWITFTDSIAHAVCSGQYALEQTCIVPRRAMLQPDMAPVAKLEKAAGRRLSAV